MNYSTMHDPSVFAEMTAEAMKASDFVHEARRFLQG